MAWEGAFGLVPPEADNCVLSVAFVAYEIDSTVIEPKFLEYLFKVPSHWKQIGRQSTGTNVRRQSLHPLQFEESKIPCPTLIEQQAIVARLDQLADKVRQINENPDAIDAIAEALLISLHHKFAADRIVRLGDIIELFEESVSIKPDGEYPQVGVRGFGGGLFAKVALAGTETSYRTFNRAIVLSQVKGREGLLWIAIHSNPKKSFKDFRLISGAMLKGVIQQRTAQPSAYSVVGRKAWYSASWWKSSH